MNGLPCPDISDFVITDHAREQLRRRAIDEEAVAMILRDPGQRELVREGRCVYQSIVADDEGFSERLLRAFVDVDPVPPEVITVYMMSKIDEYWRGA